MQGILDFTVDFPPFLSVSYTFLEVGGTYFLVSFKMMKKRSPQKLSFKVKSVNDQAGPGAHTGFPTLDYNCGKARLSPSWVFPLPDQVLLSSYCVSAGGWQCRWLLSGSVWVLFFHPLIKSCTFLIGEQNLQKRKRNPPFQSIQRLKFIWLWNAHQGLNTSLRDNCWKPVTLIWKRKSEFSWDRQGLRLPKDCLSSSLKLKSNSRMVLRGTCRTGCLGISTQW